MLDLLFGRPRRHVVAGDGWSDSGWWGGRTRTQANIVVDEDLALTYAAVWCATRILSETSASLPLFLYRRLPGDDRELATDHPLFDLLHSSPNPDMGSMAFREGRTAHQVNWGNAFAEIEWDNMDQMKRQRVVALWPIHPCRVRPIQWNADAYRQGYRYLVRNNDGSLMPLRADEMLHIPGVLSDDGVWGKGVIQHARESIGLGIATERHGATYFGGGNMPRGIVFAPGLRSGEQRDLFRKEWREVHGSPDSAEVAILPVESKFERFIVSNEDGQFLGTRKHNKNEIATWYRIPPHMLGDLEHATFSNIEHSGIEFVVYSLFPWLRRWEEQLTLKLLPSEERKQYFIEHQLAALLRGDIKSRFEAYATALTHGFMTHNEVRRFENLNSFGPEADRLYVQAQMVPLGTTPSNDADTAMVPAAGAEEPVQRAKPYEPPGDDDDAARARQARALGAAGAVLASTLSRMFTKEANAALRAASGKDFDAWLPEFYGRHRQTLTAALSSVMPVLALAGLAIDPEALVERLLADSMAELQHAYNTDTPAQLAARLADWPKGRAVTVADKILEGG